MEESSLTQNLERQKENLIPLTVELEDILKIFSPSTRERLKNGATLYNISSLPLLHSVRTNGQRRSEHKKFNIHDKGRPPNEVTRVKVFF